LESINTNTQELEGKESILSENLYTENKDLYINQINLLYEVANKSGLKVDTIKKEEVKRSDDEIEKFNIEL
jgi:hypothetical protein